MINRPRKYARAGYPNSPCVDMCTLDDNNVCVGCARSVDEIIAWATMTAAEQWKIVRMLAERNRQ